MDGLFCERVFGPSKSFECACGKYKQVRYKGLICERCGVELTESRVRRHRMGHVKLIYPIAHVWYMNSRPNYMALLLEVEQCEKRLDTGIYFERRFAQLQAFKIISLNKTRVFTKIFNKRLSSVLKNKIKKTSFYKWLLTYKKIYRQEKFLLDNLHETCLLYTSPSPRDA